MFNPTYGLSKAVAVDYCFSPLYLNFSFKPPTSLKNLYFISPGRLSKCRGRFWPEPLEGEANANFKRHAWLKAVYFPRSLTVSEPHLLTYGWKVYLYLYFYNKLSRFEKCMWHMKGSFWIPPRASRSVTIKFVPQRVLALGFMTGFISSPSSWVLCLSHESVV